MRQNGLENPTCDLKTRFDSFKASTHRRLTKGESEGGPIPVETRESAIIVCHTMQHARLYRNVMRAGACQTSAIIGYFV
jgi:hypothetical protein